MKRNVLETEPHFSNVQRIFLKGHIPAAFEAWASREGNDLGDHKLTLAVRGAKMPLRLASINASMSIQYNDQNTYVQQQNGNNEGEPLTITYKWIVPIQEEALEWYYVSIRC